MNPAGSSSQKLDGLNIVREILRDLLDSDTSSESGKSSSSSRSESDEEDNVPSGSVVNIVFDELSTDIVRAASITNLYQDYDHSSQRCSTPKLQLEPEILPVLTSYASEEEGFSTSVNDSVTDSENSNEEESSPRCLNHNEYHTENYQYNSTNLFEETNFTRSGLCDEDSGLYSADVESNGTGKTLSLSEAFQDTENDVTHENANRVLATDKEQMSDIFSESFIMEQNREGFEDLLENKTRRPRSSSTSTLSQMIETATNAIIDESISQVMVLNMTTPEVSFTSEGFEDSLLVQEDDIGFENLKICHPEDHLESINQVMLLNMTTPEVSFTSEGFEDSLLVQEDDIGFENIKVCHPEDQPDSKIPSKLYQRDEDKPQLELEQKLFQLSQFLAKSAIDETIEEIGLDPDIDFVESSSSEEEEEEEEQITARRISITGSNNPADGDFTEAREASEEECKMSSAVVESMVIPQSHDDSYELLEVKSANSGSLDSAEFQQEEENVLERITSLEDSISLEAETDEMKASRNGNNIPEDAKDLSSGGNENSTDFPSDENVLDHNLSSSAIEEDVQVGKGIYSSYNASLKSQELLSEISEKRSDGELKIYEEDSTDNADTLSTLSSVNNENVEVDVSELNREYKIDAAEQDETSSFPENYSSTSTNQQTMQPDDKIETSVLSNQLILDADDIATSVRCAVIEEELETEYEIAHSGAAFISRYIAVEENNDKYSTKPKEHSAKSIDKAQDNVDTPTTEYDREYERLLAMEPLSVKDSFDYQQRENALHFYLASKETHEEKEEDREVSMAQEDSKDPVDVIMNLQLKASANDTTDGIKDELDEENQKDSRVPGNALKSYLASKLKCEYVEDLKAPLGIAKSENILNKEKEDMRKSLQSDQLQTSAEEEDFTEDTPNHKVSCIAVHGDSNVQDKPDGVKSSLGDDWLSANGDGALIKTISHDRERDKWSLPEFAVSNTDIISNSTSQLSATQHYEIEANLTVSSMEMTTKPIHDFYISGDIDEEHFPNYNMNQLSAQSHSVSSLISGSEKIKTQANIPSIQITEPMYSDDTDSGNMDEFYEAIRNGNLEDDFQNYSSEATLSSPRKISTTERQMHTKAQEQIALQVSVPSRTNPLHINDKTSGDTDQFYEAIFNENIGNGLPYYSPKRSSTPEKIDSERNGEIYTSQGYSVSSPVRSRFDLDSVRESPLWDVDRSSDKCRSTNSSFLSPVSYSQVREPPRNKFSYIKQQSSSLCKMTQSMAETLAAVRNNLRLSKEDINNFSEDFTRTESRVKRLFEEHPTTLAKNQGSGIAASHWFSPEVGYRPKEREHRTREELRDKLHELDLLNHSSSSELALAESNLESLRQENRDLRASFENEVIDLKFENSKMKDKVDRINEISAENLLLASDAADLQGELSELRTEARALRNRCHELTEDNRQLKMEVRDLRRYIEAMAKNKRTDSSQDLLDKIDYYQREHDRLLEEVRGLKQRLGSITPRSPRSRSPACSRSPRQTPSKSLQSSKEVRFRDGSLEKPTARDAIAASTATSHGADRVIKDRGMSPSVALNLRDLTMDRYQKHLDGHDSPRSVGSDSTEMLLNQQPTLLKSKRTTCGADLSDDDAEFNELTCGSGLTNGKLSGMEFDKSGTSDCSKHGRMTPTKLQQTTSPLGGAGYRSISPRNKTSLTHSIKSCTDRYPPEICQSLPRRAFAPRNPSDLRLGYAIKFTRPGGKVSRGTVKFIGHLAGRSEVFVGVESDNHDGKHSGTFQGKKYFSCPTNKGIFTPFSKIIMAWE